MKIGNRVTVLEPSDPNAKTGDGTPVSRYVGKRGGVMAIDEEKGLVLVDDQYQNYPKQEGGSYMREWFKPEHLEVG